MMPGLPVLSPSRPRVEPRFKVDAVAPVKEHPGHVKLNERSCFSSLLSTRQADDHPVEVV